MGRRAPAAESSNLDSLLDTLTDVIGAMVLLLVMVRLDVGQSIDRVLGIDPNASAATVARLEQELAAANDEMDRIIEEDQQSLRGPDSLKAIRARIVEYEKTLAQPAPDPQKLEDLRKSVEQLTAQAETLDEERVRIEGSIADLRARLETMPQPKTLPARNIPLPNPRAPAPSAKPVYLICRADRLAFVDQPTAIAFVADMLRKRTLIGENRCDCDKAVKIFADESPGNEDIRFELREVGKVPHLVFHIREGKGLSAKELRRSDSAYARGLASLDRNASYLQFLVWPDGFDVYLSARKECDEKEVPAGWLPMAPGSDWILSLRDQFVCDGYVAPPPAPPPPETDKIVRRGPAPVDTLD